MLKLTDVRFAYRTNGKGYAVTTAESIGNSRVNLDVYDDGEVFRASVKTKSEIEIVKLAARFSYDFRENDRIFLNGYQSWTDSFEHTVRDTEHGIDHVPDRVNGIYAFNAYGDYDFVKYVRRKGRLHGFSYGYVKDSFGRFDFIGSINENCGFTVIKTDTAKKTITIEKDCRGLFVNGSYDGIAVYMGSGSENEVFDRYFELMSIPPTREKPIFGYTSWYRHYQDICEKYLLDDLEGIRACGFKADVFQIDDGYQTAVGDWLSVDMAKFPNGMRPLAERIASEGMTPGLWLAPFVCEQNSEIFREHPEWLLRDGKGEPVRAGCNWSNQYALDIYNNEFRDYLHEVFRTVTEEWGFELLKLDFLYAACILPRRDKTRGRVMADGMDLLRELAGGAKILGCGVPVASAFGTVDFCRIGTDVTPEWDGQDYMKLFHRERPSTKYSILNSVFRRQLSGRAFINDPDVFMLRDTDNTMTVKQRRTLAEINAMCGGVLFNSDNMGEYGDVQHELFGDLMVLHGAKVLSAELDGNRLTIAAEKEGKNFIREYTI